MDIKWSYYLIVALYAILIVLKWLGKKEEVRFIEQNESTDVFKALKKDFFTTIACICTVITLCINGAALISGRPLVLTSIIITACIIGMAFLTTRIRILTTSQGKLWIDGIELGGADIEEVVIKEKKNKTYYQILLEKPVNGYESVSFTIVGAQRETFTTYVKSI